MEQLSQSTIEFIRAHSRDDVRLLALQAPRYPDVDMPAAIVQIAGRQAAANKIPSWQSIEELWYPRHLSLEQCSSEITAQYKSTLADGETLADLTGGFGIDCAFMASRFRKVSYVERQEELCEIAKHNFPLLGLKHITVYNEDGVVHLQKMEPVDCIFIDPARRNEHGGKTIAISDCEPDVAELEELLLSKGKQIIIKLSPMLDLTLALKSMKRTREVHIISVNNECKELLLIIGNEPSQLIPIHCINLTSKEKQTFTFTREEELEAECLYTKEPGKYLYEPNASILKAGAFRSIASRYKVKKLHPNSHLYTSDLWIENFPGRSFQITGQCSFNKKEIKETIGELKKANITVRNFPATVAEIRKRTKLSDGGEVYLFATTLFNEQKVFIKCSKA
ncbi:SAM-dependent methyltransferase [Bacteroides sp. K03]|uniref:THUMP-like domain-containing protein n=1 Tax=Bacteroides sp. K03 TaxID=2718928 RepID=UPI001C8B94C4|nr:SAM-dependent methyltransferase [Bacteroides sp. K03]MBX9189697.1 SAM-dependent methyltransferase [Bacteroides sp. K03]